MGTRQCFSTRSCQKATLSGGLSIKVDADDTSKERCQVLIEEKCTEQGWTILTLAIQPDHIHLFVWCFPGDSAADVVKQCKGYTAFHLCRKFKPILSKLPSLWTRSYFSSTAGNVSQETIQRYFDAQEGV